MSDIHILIDEKNYLDSSKTGFTAIQNFKLLIPEQQFICLVGPSGCGKTTLLNVISQLDQQFQGEINFDQHTDPTIGYVFQNPRLLPWRTARENIELVMPDTHSNEFIDQLFAEMQLSDVQDKYPHQLSLGMCRRISIIRAFAINPDILLMDEPFVSLDPPTARQIRQFLVDLWQKRPHSILFVTHDLREAIALADRLVFLSKSPMSVISEIDIPISRCKRNDANEIEHFRQQLASNFPEIKDLL